MWICYYGVLVIKQYPEAGLKLALNSTDLNIKVESDCAEAIGLSKKIMTTSKHKHSRLQGLVSCCRKNETDM
jgi:hypothetical protein